MVDDEEYIEQAITLARQPVKDGNTPFGSLLVIDDSVIRTAKNMTVVDDDIAAHPEFKLARWAASELETDRRASCTMYTSTEPCAMCASTIHYARLGRVVYSVSGPSLAEIRGCRGIDISCDEVIQRGNGLTEVDGPLLEEEGLQVHEEFY